MKKKSSRKISVAGAWSSALRPMIVGQPDQRVKNSLEQVASLLRLQAANDVLTSPDEALADAAARIKALAHWHAFLSQTKTGGRRDVALDGYLNAFADHFVDAYTAESKIVLLVNADPILVPARVAGMLGQIVNELVLNALRRAFSAKRSGTIQVECGRDADGRVVLQVSDDTKGYANGHGPRPAATFDMQIVAALVKQLGGTFSAPTSGARIFSRVTIPLPSRASSRRPKRQVRRK